MKLSVAVTLLASASTAIAFQAPSSAFSTSSRRSSRLHVLAIDPTTGALPVPLKPPQQEEPKVEFDMSGIAFSVRYITLHVHPFDYINNI